MPGAGEEEDAEGEAEPEDADPDEQRRDSDHRLHGSSIRDRARGSLESAMPPARARADARENGMVRAASIEIRGIE